VSPLSSSKNFLLINRLAYLYQTKTEQKYSCILFFFQNLHTHLSLASGVFAPKPPPGRCPWTALGTCVSQTSCWSPATANFWLRPCVCGRPLKKLKQTVLSFGDEKALQDARKLLQIFYDVNWCLFRELVLIYRLQTTGRVLLSVCMFANFQRSMLDWPVAVCWSA